jgi:hypothetical protein
VHLDFALPCSQARFWATAQCLQRYGRVTLWTQGTRLALGDLATFDENIIHRELCTARKTPALKYATSTAFIQRHAQSNSPAKGSSSPSPHSHPASPLSSSIPTHAGSATGLAARGSGAASRGSGAASRGRRGFPRQNMHSRWNPPCAQTRCGLQPLHSHFRTPCTQLDLAMHAEQRALTSPHGHLVTCRHSMQYTRTLPCRHPPPRAATHSAQCRLRRSCSQMPGPLHSMQSYRWRPWTQTGFFGLEETSVDDVGILAVWPQLRPPNHKYNMCHKSTQQVY